MAAPRQALRRCSGTPSTPDAQLSEQGGPGGCTAGWQNPAVTKGPASPAPSEGWSRGPRSPSPSVSRERHSGLPEEHKTQKQAVLAQRCDASCSSTRLTGTPQATARPERRWRGAAGTNIAPRAAALPNEDRPKPLSTPNSPAGSAQPSALGTPLEDDRQCKAKLCPCPAGHGPLWPEAFHVETSTPLPLALTVTPLAHLRRVGSRLAQQFIQKCLYTRAHQMPRRCPELAATQLKLPRFSS